MIDPGAVFFPLGNGEVRLTYKGKQLDQKGFVSRLVWQVDPGTDSRRFGWMRELQFVAKGVPVESLAKRAWATYY